MPRERSSARIRFGIGLTIGLLALPGTSVAQTATPVLTSLDSPVFVTSWPGNAGVLVVVERGSGRITRHAVGAGGGGGIPVQGLILDLSAKSFTLMNAHLEFIGVTGVAFHPDFLDDRNKRFLYVRYNEEAPAPTTIIERYHVPPGTLSADPATATLFFSFPTIETGHGSGQIHFDTREPVPNMTLLYFTMPDDKVGSATCGEKEIVQDDGSRLGKFFALNVEEGSPPAILPEPAMLGKGLRNPFGMSVDRGDGNGQGLGDVWIGNTGPDCPGDILRWVVGTSGVQNFGWPWKIGDCSLPDGDPPTLVVTSCPLPPNPPPFTDPVRVVSKFLTSDGNNDALIGGYVYRGTNVDTLTNKYVFALYGKHSPKVLALRDADAPSDDFTEDLTGALGVNTWPAGSLHGLGQDTDGELYLIRVNTNQPVTNNGTIYRID